MTSLCGAPDWVRPSLRSPAPKLLAPCGFRRGSLKTMFQQPSVLLFQYPSFVCVFLPSLSYCWPSKSVPAELIAPHVPARYRRPVPSPASGFAEGQSGSQSRPGSGQAPSFRLERPQIEKRDRGAALPPAGNVGGPHNPRTTSRLPARHDARRLFARCCNFRPNRSRIALMVDV